MAQDVPKLWAYVGQTLAAALLASESASGRHRLMLTEFRDAFREAGDSAGAELLAQTLLAVKRKPSSNDQVMAFYRPVSDRLSTDFAFTSDQVVTAALRKHVSYFNFYLIRK